MLLGCCNFSEEAGAFLAGWRKFFHKLACEGSVNEI